jgi:quinol monooxygenase YgiN
MVIIAGHVHMDAEKRDAYVEAFRDLVSRARASDGCIDLAISADPVDPTRVYNLEVWESAAALDAFRKVAKPPETGIEFTAEEVKRYDAEDGGPLF